MSDYRVSYGRVFGIAWPMMVANCSTPLLGLVDTAVIGNTGSAAALGAIALGALIFAFVYWMFGFLRMGTTGFTAQALGADNGPEISAIIARTSLLGLGLGLVIVILQWPVGWIAFRLLSGSPEAEELALDYFQIGIWGAPASFVFFSVLGWLIGLQKVRTALVLQLFMNVINMALDVIFVTQFHWGVKGVAAGTLIAEIVTAGAALMTVRHHMDRGGYSLAGLSVAKLVEPAVLARLISVNGDIFIRTLCLLLVFSWFTSSSAGYGDAVLAANHILLQLISFSAFFLDGYAFAAESLVGWAIGAKSRQTLMEVIRKSTLLAAVTALVLSILLLALGRPVIDSLTAIGSVRQVAYGFLPWCGAVPILSVWCFQLDGIFIGATRTAAMRNMAVLTLVLFGLTHQVLTHAFEVAGLWSALLLFYIYRAVSLLVCLPGLLKLTPEPEAAS